jgi:hypothetical protein
MSRPRGRYGLLRAAWAIAHAELHGEPGDIMRAKAFANGLLAFLDKDDFSCAVGTDALARAVGVTIRSIPNYVKSAELLRVVEVARTKGGSASNCNRYVLLVPELEARENQRSEPSTTSAPSFSSADYPIARGFSPEEVASWSAHA